MSRAMGSWAIGAPICRLDLAIRLNVDRLENNVVKSVEQFGKPLVSYDGAATIEVLHQEGELAIEGYFEAAQYLSGRLAVSVLPINTSRPQGFTLGRNQEREIAFSGHDSEGWTLNFKGETLFALPSWLIGSIQQRPREQTLSPEYLEAKRSDSPEYGYNEATFLITNFLWDDRYRKAPEEIQLAFDGLSVNVTPLESYLGTAQRLRRSRGAEPTARVLIELPNGHQKPLREFEETIEDLLYVFRIVTGNLVNWCFGEAVDRSGNPVERIHKYGISANYSDVMKFRPLRAGQASRVPKLDLLALARAFSQDSGHRLSKGELRRLINQFANACDSTLNLESSGLLASTLSELIAAKYSRAMRTSDSIPEGKFRKNVLPILKAAIESTDLCPDITEQMIEHFNGMYRRSLRYKLEGLNKDLDLRLSETEIKRIVRVRNSLVHNGSYPDRLEDGRWAGDYDLMIWLNFVSLCRLSGYGGDLPEFDDWQSHGV